MKVAIIEQQALINQLSLQLRRQLSIFTRFPFFYPAKAGPNSDANVDRFTRVKKYFNGYY